MLVLWRFIQDDKGFTMRRVKILSLPIALAILAGCGGGSTNTQKTSTALPKAWGTPTKLAELQNGTIEAPRIALNSKGDKAVVWIQGIDIYAKFYHTSTGWGKSMKITNNGVFNRVPNIVLDDNGNAMAVWLKHSPTNYSLLASKYSKSSGWSTPQDIDNGNKDVGIFNLGIDKSGNIVVLWEQDNASNNRDLYFRKYNKLSGSWGSITTIDDGAKDVSKSKLAVNANGDAVAVWLQDAPHLRQYNHTTNSWNNIKTLNSASSYNINVAINDNSQAVVVWDLLDSGLKHQLVAQIYNPSSGWGTIETIDSLLDTVAQLEVSIDNSSNIHTVFSNNILKTIKYDITKSAWETPKTLYKVLDSQLLTNSNGNSMITMTIENNNTYEAFATKYSNKNENWSSKESMENAIYDINFMNSAIDKYGNITTVFVASVPNKPTLYVNEYE